MADSWVWGHFTKPAKKGDKATCAIVGSNGKLCGAQIAYTSSTSSLAYHLTSVHGLERGTPSKKQKTLKWGHYIGTSPEFPLNERELLCVTWASNGLAYDLIEDALFRRCFGGSIPIGMDRHKISTEMVTLANRYCVINETISP